jgi:hypothetical protein
MTQQCTLHRQETTLGTYHPIDTASISTGNRIFNTSYPRFGAGPICHIHRWSWIKAQGEKRRSKHVIFLYSLHLIVMIIIQEKMQRADTYDRFYSGGFCVQSPFWTLSSPVFEVPELGFSGVSQGRLVSGRSACRAPETPEPPGPPEAWLIF